MLFKAFVRAVVLLIVRRWWGRISAFSSEARDSISERGMPSSSSSSASSGFESSASSPPKLLSLSLSSSIILEVSIYDLVNIDQIIEVADTRHTTVASAASLSSLSQPSLSASGTDAVPLTCASMFSFSSNCDLGAFVRFFLTACFCNFFCFSNL